MSFQDFLNACTVSAYAEPPSDLHKDLTALAVDDLAKELPAGAVVLDVGCGQGYALRKFKAAGFDPIGLSVLPTETSKLREEGFDVRDAEMHSIAQLFAPATFDCVFARHVLEHSPAPFFMLTRIRQVMKQGAVLYMEVPLADTENHHERNPNHYSCLPASCWAQLLARAGFDKLKAQRLEFKTMLGQDEYFICKAYAA